MHFTLESARVAMVVARDLVESDVKSPNIKGVLLTRGLFEAARNEQSQRWVFITPTFHYRVGLSGNITIDFQKHTNGCSA